MATTVGETFADYLNVDLGFGLNNTTYLPSALMFGAVIAAIAVAHLKYGLNAVLAFWLAYILARPLGASIGDYLSQPQANGGLGLGTTGTSALFLVTILALVSFLTITKRDQTPTEVVAAEV